MRKATPRTIGEVERPTHRRPTAIKPLLTALGPGVYAVRTHDHLIKIGYTNDLGRRCQQVGTGQQSILGWKPGTRADETAVHQQLDGLAVHGREYYPECAPVMVVVNGMRASLHAHLSGE